MASSKQRLSLKLSYSAYHVAEGGYRTVRKVEIKCFQKRLLERGYLAEYRGRGDAKVNRKAACIPFKLGTADAVDEGFTVHSAVDFLSLVQSVPRVLCRDRH